MPVLLGTHIRKSIVLGDLQLLLTLSSCALWESLAPGSPTSVHLSPLEDTLNQGLRGLPPEFPVEQVWGVPENLFSHTVPGDQEAVVQGPPLESHLSRLTFSRIGHPRIPRNLGTFLVVEHLVIVGYPVC